MLERAQREEVIHMDKRIAKFALAGALTGLLGAGGMAVASAQDSDSGSSTTTSVDSTAPDASATAPAAGDRENCPDKPTAEDTTADADTTS
jgi:hypothetical protein